MNCGIYHTAAQTQTSWQIESGTYGTASGAQQWLGLVQDHTPDDSEGREAHRYVGGGDRNVDIFLDQGTVYTNSVPYFMQTGKLLAAALGTVATTGSPNYLHTISESGCIPSFTLEEASEANATQNMIRTYAGCMVDTLEISAEEKAPVTTTVGLVAQSNTFTSGTKTTVTADTVKPYMWSHTRLMISGGAFGTSDYEKFSTVMSWTWGLENNLTPPNYCDGSENIGLPVPGDRNYNFEFTMNSTAKTGADIYSTLFKGGSEANLDLYLERTSGSDYFQIAMSGCKTLDADVPLPHEGGPVEMVTVMQPTSCTILVRDSTEEYPFESV